MPLPTKMPKTPLSTPPQVIRTAQEHLDRDLPRLVQTFGFRYTHQVLGVSESTMRNWRRRGAPRYARFALIGMLAVMGKPFGALWPDH